MGEGRPDGRVVARWAECTRWVECGQMGEKRKSRMGEVQVVKYQRGKMPAAADANDPRRCNGGRRVGRKDRRTINLAKRRGQSQSKNWKSKSGKGSISLPWST